MTHQQQTAFENIVGKGEISRNEQFLLFPQCFLLNQIIVSPFVHIFDVISSFAAEFKKPKIGISGKGLKRRLSDWSKLKAMTDNKLAESSPHNSVVRALDLKTRGCGFDSWAGQPKNY